MNKIIFVLILLVLCSRIAFAEDISNEEKQIIKDRITANDPGRDLLLDQLLRETNGAEIDFALPYLNDPRADVRAVIAWKLGFYGDPSVVIPALMKAREDKNWIVRRNVAGSLARRGKEEEAVSIYIGLIMKEKHSYSEIYKEIKSMKDMKAKDMFKEEILKMINNDSLPIITQAYAISFLVYVYYEPLTPAYKEVIVKTLKYVENSTDRMDPYIMSDIIGALLPDQGINIEDYKEIAILANNSKHKYVKQAGESRLKLLENLQQK